VVQQLAPLRLRASHRVSRGARVGRPGRQIATVDSPFAPRHPADRRPSATVCFHAHLQRMFGQVVVLQRRADCPGAGEHAGMLAGAIAAHRAGCEIALVSTPGRRSSDKGGWLPQRRSASLVLRFCEHLPRAFDVPLLAIVRAAHQGEIGFLEAEALERPRFEYS